ncbi:hypothetical protein KP509_31G009600 [Ceratopteris richardii]|uniref:Uncharacterized protein n=1 Tax=Ceratopteris richardii TaxID=49495 RepID=A0A8T2QXA7_CERRI|nr:hypothetical protein KP509_31G009600 [Ceratopteris richardii]
MFIHLQVMIVLLRWNPLKSEKDMEELPTSFLYGGLRPPPVNGGCERVSAYYWHIHVIDYYDLNAIPSRTAFHKGRIKKH